MTAPGAVEFRDVRLDYRIFHDRTSSLFEAMSNLFSRRTRSEHLRALDGVSFSIAPGRRLR